MSPRDRLQGWGRALVRRGDHLAIVLVVAVLLPRLLLGDRPASWDHVVHYTKAWSFLHRLPHLDLWSWDWRMYAGFPTEFGYPVTAESVVVAVWGAFLGSISLSRAYAWSIFAVYVFGAEAIYRTLSRLVGRGAAAVATLLYLTDFGWFFAGGWFFTLLFGVWPAFLGVAIGLLLLSTWLDVLRDASRTRYLTATLWLGLAVLSHPVEMIFVPMMFLALAIWVATEPELRTRCTIERALKHLAVSVPGAAALAAFWLVPFLRTSAFTLDRGVAGTGVHDMLVALAGGKLFDNMVPLAAWGGLAGLMLCFRSGGERLVGLFWCLALAAMTTLPRDVVFALAGVDLNHKVEFPRIGMLLKPFWFAAAAWIVIALGRVVLRRGGRWALAGAVAAAAIAVALRPGVVLKMAVPFPMEYRAPRDLEDMRAVGAWLDARAHEGSGFFRAGHSPVNNHDLVELGTMTTVPLLKGEFTPGVNFSSNMLPMTPETADAVNVRYFVATEPYDQPGYVLIQTLGPYGIYENRRWSPEVVRVARGTGTIANASVEPRAIEFDASAGSSGSALVAAGYFPDWKATRDGVEVPVAPESLDGAPGHTLMSVPLAPGHYVLAFRRSAVDVAAFLLSGAAWAALAACAVTAVRRRRSTRVAAAV